MRICRPAFTLIELTTVLTASIVLVALSATVAAHAIPRSSRNTPGCTDCVITADLAILRAAIDLYRTEHNGSLPPLATIAASLTQHSSKDGTSTQPDSDAAHPLGPYVRVIPALPLGANKHSTGIASASTPGIGWIYNETTGAIRANTTTEADASGRLYSAY